MNAHQRRVALRKKWDMKAIKALPTFTFDMESDFFIGGSFRPGTDDFFNFGLIRSCGEQVSSTVRILKERPTVAGNGGYVFSPDGLKMDFTALEERIEQYFGKGSVA